MKLTFLGTGASMGIPIINCDCGVCTSHDARDARLRCGARLEINGRTYLIDASSDLRQQALRYGLDRLDGVFITHSHADHVFGLDDTRIYSIRTRSPIRIFASRATLDSIRRLFWYAFEGPRDERLAKPVFQMTTPEDAAVQDELDVASIPVLHGKMPVTGYRFGKLAYLTDFNRIGDEALNMLTGLDTLVLGALRHSPSISHLTIPEAIALAEQIRPRITYLTHFTHEVSQRELEQTLPNHIRPAYDGLVIDIPDDEPGVESGRISGIHETADN